MSLNDVSSAPGRGTYTPSTNVPTLGSMPLLPAAPMPRMVSRTLAVCAPRVIAMFGTSRCRSSTLFTPAVCSVSPENAATDSGTS